MDENFYETAIKEINDLLFTCPFSIIHPDGHFEHVPELSTGDKSAGDKAYVYYYDSRDDDIWPIEHRLGQIYEERVDWTDILYFTDGWGEKRLLKDFVNVKYFIKFVYNSKECGPFTLEEEYDDPVSIDTP
jgi:hypothetical protein